MNQKQSTRFDISMTAIASEVGVISRGVVEKKITLTVVLFKLSHDYFIYNWTLFIVSFIHIYSSAVIQFGKEMTIILPTNEGISSKSDQSGMTEPVGYEGRAFIKCDPHWTLSDDSIPKRRQPREVIKAADCKHYSAIFGR